MYAYSKVLVGSLTAASLATLFTVVTPMSAQALTCTGTVTSGVGRNMQRSVAERNARIKWRAKVRLSKGWPFSDWDKAKNRHYSCGTFGKLYKKWGCRAIAKPCK